MPGRRTPFLTFLAAALLLLASPVRALPTDVAVKAVYLPKLARYVTWPAHVRPRAGEPLNLCVIGRDEFGTVLDRAAAGQTAGQSPIVVRRLSSASQAAPCHLAFVDGGSAERTASILAALRKWPILTVTDGRAGASQGMIHFVVREGRVRFYIDEAAARRSNLQLDSRLLGIAIGVRQRAQ